MRNYPLLLKNGNMPTPKNWQNTYVRFLSAQTKSLVDYSNYFLADYRIGPGFLRIQDEQENPDQQGNRWGVVRELKDDQIILHKAFSIETLKYHQYNDTEESEAVYFLNSNDYAHGMIYNASDERYRKIKNGRHIINNNQKESSTLSYKDWQNIAIQPMGYAAFYLIYFENGKLRFEYTKNAQLYYGDSSPVQILDFYTRYFYEYQNIMDYHIETQSEQYKTIDILSTLGGEPVIKDRQGFSWTDRRVNLAIGFNIIKTDSNPFGEEVIIDATREYTMRVDKVGVATYTMTIDGDLAAGDRYWPSGSYVRFI